MRLSHDQQNLYISNRGHDSIAIFTVVDDGKGINPIEIVKGEFQEILILLSQMNTLYVHIKKEIALTVFRRDTNSGMLIATDNQYTAPEGVFVDFLNSLL